MGQGNLVVVAQSAVAIGRKYPADAAHAERMQLRGPERAHAGSPENVNSPAHGPQDFLVPDRRNAVEIAVDKADGSRPFQGGAIDIALRRRRPAAEIGRLGRIAVRQGRPDEKDCGNAHQSRPASARSPGT